MWHSKPYGHEDVPDHADADKGLDPNETQSDWEARTPSPIDHLATPVKCCTEPPPWPLALVWGWSEDSGGCVAMILNMSRLRHFQTVCLGVLWRSVAFCHDPRRLITRLNGRWYLWCRCRSAMTSNKHWCRPSEYAHSTDLARKSAERRGPIWSSGMEHLFSTFLAIQHSFAR